MAAVDTLPTAADVADAARRLAGVAARTPLLEFEPLNDAAGREVLVKAETLQRTGSFKFRGAYNRLARLDATERRAGVVAYSSGNHAQGVAAAARLLGLPAAIVMPADAPTAKIARTRRHGAEIVVYDRKAEDRAAIAEALAEERGAVLVPPFDDPFVIAAQGTVGMEIAEQCAERGVRPDAVLVPCSGGGLSAGIALGLARSLPDAAVHTVEPAGWDDTARSLAAEQPMRVGDDAPATLCDALMVTEPGRLTLPILRAHRVAGLTVTEDAVKAAIAFAFHELKLVVEPGGAVALAAALGGLPADGRGGPLVVVASGGNVDAALFAALIAPAATGDG